MLEHAWMQTVRLGRIAFLFLRKYESYQMRLPEHSAAVVEYR